MRCIEWRDCIGLATLGLLAACTPPANQSPTGGSAMPPVVQRPDGLRTSPASPASPPVSTTPMPGAAGAAVAAAKPIRLSAPRSVRNWNEVRLQAAERIVAANPDGTYTGVVPEALLAIPVLEIELNGDGSVRRIVVLRPPRHAKDTIELATSAVRRAAPFGDVSRLPKPWKFVETFLFDDDRRFKPRTLNP